MISPVLNYNYSAPNSNEFIKKVKGFSGNKNCGMIPFDVFNLFTSVSLEKVLCVTLEKLLSDKFLSDHTKLTDDDIIECFSLCFDSTVFVKMCYIIRFLGPQRNRAFP